MPRVKQAFVWDYLLGDDDDGVNVRIPSIYLAARRRAKVTVTPPSRGPPSARRRHRSGSRETTP